MNRLIYSLFFAIVAAAFFIGCSSSPNPEINRMSTTLRLNWIYTGSFAGDALAATNVAQRYDLQLKLQPGGQGLDPIKLTNENEFGAASSDEVLVANEKGADLVIVGVVNDVSPAVFISKAEDNIKEPKDFEGKTVGVLPFGSTGLVYKALLKKANVDASKVKEKTVSPDLKVFLSTDSYQVQPAFVFDEPVSLDAQGIKYNLIEPKNYGVRFKGVCYFTTRSTVEKNPKLVQAFVNTMAEAWKEVIASPQRGIASLKKLAPDIDEARELKVIERGIPYFEGNGQKPLTSDMASWNEMANDLKEFGLLQNTDVIPRTLNFTFVDNFYNNVIQK